MENFKDQINAIQHSIILDLQEKLKVTEEKVKHLEELLQLKDVILLGNSNDNIQGNNQKHTD